MKKQVTIITQILILASQFCTPAYGMMARLARHTAPVAQKAMVKPANLRTTQTLVAATGLLQTRPQPRLFSTSQQTQKYYKPCDTEQAFIQCNTDMHHAATPLEYFQNVLTKHEQDAWDSMTKSGGVTKEQCLEARLQGIEEYKKSMQEYNAWIRSNLKPLQPKTVDLVRGVLPDFNLDPKNVEILPCQDISPVGALWGTTAETNDHTMYVNESEFYRIFTPEAQRFCIAHEAQHVKHYDSSILGLLTTTFMKKCDPRKKEQFSNAVTNYCRFMEIRADIKALLDGGKAYAEGAQDIMNTFCKLSNVPGRKINYNPIYSLETTRKAMVDNICSTMQWNKKS